MLKAKDFRHQAWTALHGKWGMMALCTLIFELIIGACAGLAYFYVGGIAMLLLAGPLELGYAILALHVARLNAVKVDNLFDGFKNYVKALALYIINGIFIALWSLLLVIPGIIKTYSYSMSMYILADNPDIDANEARKQSMAMMKGNKWRLFCLDFSFIGWWILCGITLGILSFWITPYHECAHAEFYQELLAKNGVNVQPVEEAPAALPEAPADPYAEEAPAAEEAVEENNTDAE